MRVWRSHPVLFAALVGAAIGLANAVFIEIEGLRGKNSSAVLPLLTPGGAFGQPHGAVQMAAVLFIEVLANVVVFAGFFVIPTAAVVALRRAFHALKNRRL